MGRVGAHGGVAGRGRAGLDTNRTVCTRDKPPLTFNVELANGDPEVVDKLVEVQKHVQKRAR